MVNGAPGSAWASLRTTPGRGVDELLILGTPAHDDRTPLNERHLFDLASLTKVFTAVAALRLVDQGRVDLDAPVAPVLDAGSGEGAGRITLRHLLTHSSGLPAEGREWRDGIRGDELRARVLQRPLGYEPGGGHLYSDVGYIGAGEYLERVAGRPLAELWAEVATAIGAGSLTWSPDPREAVATEDQPHRGPVRGDVHDELAHALERPAGHAGLFGSVHDVAALARMIREDGQGPRERVLSTDSTRALRVPTVRADAGYGQAIGLRVRDESWMSGIDAVGHTGFTGTCFAVHTGSGGFGVLLVNRVHPSREDADIAAVRRAFLAPLAS
ncbi:serine hydrolase [Microbacterium oxydans]|uniref:serine hydrolase domain-containing protein n=1 Tax=Microbacterium oxydans TaxID=82380 RepID=UPI000F8F878E|nr:serine hydrolase domain-containing protein [Microbacterium oxydans]AZS48792.1 Esterase EstB [Microbacterium oxydans]